LKKASRFDGLFFVLKKASRFEGGRSEESCPRSAGLIFWIGDAAQRQASRRLVVSVANSNIVCRMLEAPRKFALLTPTYALLAGLPPLLAGEGRGGVLFEDPSPAALSKHLYKPQTNP
jgi:hypothetical protein